MKFWIARYADYPENLILGGDFNCALNENDRLNRAGNKDASGPVLNKMLEHLKLVDAWYLKNNTPQYTYQDPKNGSKSRIDYIFISDQLKYDLKEIVLKQAPKKDRHKALFAKIKLKLNKRGKGTWKLNNNLLETPEFNMLLKETVIECQYHKDDLDKRSKWELIKILTRDGSIRLGIQRSKKQKSFISKIQKDLDTLNKAEDNGDIVDPLEKESLEKTLNNYYKEKDNGYILRSKIKFVNEGERSSKFFFNLEKNRQSSNVIRHLKDNNGNIKSTDSEILEISGEFYEKLFASKNITDEKINEYLENIDLDKKLTNAEKLMCDEKITIKEIENVIKNLKPGKSPGCDGLTTEFYKKFWHVIKEPFTEMLNETYEQGELPYTMRKAILALLYKKGDNLLLKNYRPISLTNYDYKILCFVLANRLQKVLKNIINEDQTGYIKNRYIGTNARLLCDYFEHCDNFEVPGILLMLDFEKAFDSIEWNFMYKILEKFNFGNNFIKWVKILYNQPIISIKNNGWLSGDIPLSRGVRQGCPLSALLFVLSVEVMATSIRKNPNITGFQCNDTEIKQSLYADDTTLLLNDFESLDEAINTVNKFSEVAGPILNKEKTEGILLGTLKNTVLAHNGIKFTNDAVRALGIYIGHDKEKCYEKNWTEKIEKMKLVLEKWKSRSLTIFGKILIIKTLVISKMVHTMSILNTPEEIIKDIEKLMFKYIWESNDRIKRNTLIGSKYNGGLKMLDIYSKDRALKAGWIKRLHTKNVTSSFINMYLSRFNLDINYLIQTTNTKKSIFSSKLKLPSFWCEVFATLNDCKTIKSIDILNDSEMLAQPIWLNKYFMNKNSPIFLSNWIRSGIKYIKDLFNKDGSFISENQLQLLLVNRQNWIAEYSMVKKVILKQTADTNTRLSQYINIKNRWTLLHKNNLISLKTQKSSFFYCILVEQKFIRNYMENTWERTFDIEGIEWHKIYRQKIWDITDKKLAEFNYKVISNILYTRTKLSKFKNDITENCIYCDEPQNVRHLIFECQRVNNIWAIVGGILKLNIQYKHLILGDIVTGEYIKNRNLVINYIMYAIYKFWIMAENKKLDFKNSCLLAFIKKDLLYRNMYISDNIFHAISDKIIVEL